MDDWLVAVASPALLKKHGPLPDKGDLAQFPLLHGDELGWSEWTTGDTRSMSALRGAFIDDTVSLLTAVIEGLGYGLMRWTLASNELTAGRLVLASEQIVPHRFSYYFVCPEDYATFPKVAALRSWLLQQAANFQPPPASRSPKAAGTKGAHTKRKRAAE
jgi:LysR family glycine cleavage system transcriptional activator